MYNAFVEGIKMIIGTRTSSNSRLSLHQWLETLVELEPATAQTFHLLFTEQSLAWPPSTQSKAMNQPSNAAGAATTSDCPLILPVNR